MVREQQESDAPVDARRAVLTRLVIFMGLMILVPVATLLAALQLLPEETQESYATRLTYGTSRCALGGRTLVPRVTDQAPLLRPAAPQRPD